MKLLFIAGPPSVGKTTLSKRIIEKFYKDKKIAYMKMDVVKADEDQIIAEEYGILTRKVYSGDLCPDHASVVIIKDVIRWGLQNQSDILIIESAGLCLRCAPYLNRGMGISVLSASAGINAPLKMGPMVALSDVAVVTRVDLVSQAEKEIMIQKLHDIYPKVRVFQTNALQGHSLSKLFSEIDDSEEIEENDLDLIELKGNPPVATCTICVGKKQIGWENHYGVVRKIEGNLVNNLYRGD